MAGLGDTTPTPGPDPGTDECGETLTTDGTVSGTWAAGCDSEVSGRGHARYYSFTLAQESEVTITLESTAADTYLYLRSGDARSGAFLYQNDDDGGTTKSTIEETLAADSYTIEATTYGTGETGNFTLTVAGLGDTAAPGPGIESDRVALVALYNTTDGPNWANNSGWLSDTPIGQWYGVTTNESGHVLYIDLRENSLSGQIPGDIGELGSLQRLYLSNTDGLCDPRCEPSSPTANRLPGPIPSEMSKLADLRDLRLAFLQLSGPVPAWMGDLSNLQVLELTANELSGNIPGQLGNLTNLSSLQLGHNTLTGTMPDSIGNLTGLQYLTLHDNQLTGSIPSSYGNLSNLTLAFLFSGNQLTGCIPAGLQRVPQNDFVHQLPFCDATTLEPGSVESDRAALLALYNATDGANWADSTGWLSNTPMGQWYGVTTNDSGRVTELVLGENSLAGNIPTELGELTELKVLDLGNRFGSCRKPPGTTLWVCTPSSATPNRLTGAIPADLERLVNLEQLNLSYNTLSGTIPTWLGNLSKLEVLELSASHLTGTIPGELAHLTNLKDLELSFNNLNENMTVPPWLAGMTNLQEIRLAGLSLTGTVPEWLADLPNLRILSLINNRLTGEIPSQLSQLNLSTLNLGFNRLTGSIPPELGSIRNLNRLHLSRNQLTGSIPSELGNLARLTSFLLANNGLTGPIPSQLGSLDRLQRITLAGNDLTGCVPSGLRDVPTNDFAQLDLPFCGP